MADARSPYRCYWDSCVFLSLIEGTPGRISVIEAIVDECKRGEVEIFTSVVSIAEVAYGKTEKDGKALEPAVEKKISALWLPSSPFKLVDAFQGVMEDAKALMRRALASGGMSLKPLDAVHLATAKRLAVQAVHTYDDKLPSYAKILGCKIEQPRTDSIVFPNEP
jgi:predicted nucleic acid-binding protein